MDSSANGFGVVVGRLGCGLLLGPFSCLALLWIYAWCMVDETQPDWISHKLHLMFQMPDPGLVTVFSLGGLAYAFLLVARSATTLLRQDGQGKGVRQG